MPNHSTDSAETQKLLMRIRAGERQAFDDLFDRYRDQLRHAVQLRLDSRLSARVDASDVVQEAQMEAFQRLDDYLQREPMPFGIWLRKTALQRLQNLRRDHLQAQRRAIGREQQFPDQSSMRIAAPILDGGTSLSQQFSKREYQRQIAEAVSQLAEIDREILLMRNVEGLSHREISQVLSLGYDSVRKRYGRALLKLQRILIEMGISKSQL